MFVLDEIQNYPVNWTDGMRVSAKDFSTTDKAWSDALRDVRVTLFQGNQYGLLPALRDSRDHSGYPKLEFNSTSRLLTLKECRAVTVGGYRIEITENIQYNLQVPPSFPSISIQKEEDFSVYLTVEMFDVQGAGKMSSDAPPRYLLSCPYYELSVLYKSDDIGLSGFNHLKIAEYNYRSGEFILNDQYIPPCMTIDSHPKLLELFRYTGSNLKKLHDNGIMLCRDYRTDERPDVKDAVHWVEKIMLLIAQSIWTYNDYLSLQSPVQTITYFKNLSQYILSLSDLHADNAFIQKGIQSMQFYFI